MKRKHCEIGWLPYGNAAQICVKFSHGKVAKRLDWDMLEAKKKNHLKLPSLHAYCIPYRSKIKITPLESRALYKIH